MSTRPNAQPYRFSEQANLNNNDEFGVHLTRPSVAGVKVYKPPFKGRLTATVRIFPNIDEQGQLTPYRLSAEPSDFGDWIRHYPAVSNIGEPGVTYIEKHPSDDSISIDSTPAKMLHRSVSALVRERRDPGWGGWLQGGDGRGAALPKPGGVFVVQGMLLWYRDKLQTPPIGGDMSNNESCLFYMTNSAGKAVVNLCNERNPAWQGDQGSPEALMLQDPIALNGGQFLTVYTMGEDPRVAPTPSYGGPASGNQLGQLGAMQAGQGGFNQNRGDTAKGHEAFFTPTAYGFGADLSSVAQQVRNKIKRWDDLIWIPTLQEQAALLADRFPPDMIMHAWQSRPDWIPDSVRERANARTNHGGFQNAAGFQQAFGAPTGPAFGQPSAPAGFGAPVGFGAPNPMDQGFQQPFGAAPQGFGQQAAPQAFGQAPAPQGFGQAPAPQGFGAAPQQPAPQGFGAPQQPQGFGVPAPQAFGAPQQPAPQAFGAPATTAPNTFGQLMQGQFLPQAQAAPAAPQGFGQQTAPQAFGAAPAPQGFGAAPQGFGQQAAPQAFGQAPAPQGFGQQAAPQGFGAAPQQAAPQAFGAAPQQPQSFGAPTQPQAFGQQPQAFGQQPQAFNQPAQQGAPVVDASVPTSGIPPAFNIAQAPAGGVAFGSGMPAAVSPEMARQLLAGQVGAGGR